MNPLDELFKRLESNDYEEVIMDDIEKFIEPAAAYLDALYDEIDDLQERIDELEDTNIELTEALNDRDY